MKKRLLSLLLALALLCALLPQTATVARADDPVYSGSCGDNLTWTLYMETGLLKIEGSGAMAYYGYSAPWWSAREIITAVEFPEGITSIGDFAFYDCTGLTSIELPESVTSIGNSAFSGCTGLSSITIPAGVSAIGECAFAYCTALTMASLPNSLVTIEDGAFLACRALTEISLPSGLRQLGTTGLVELDVGWIEREMRGVFEGCTSLTSVSFSEGLSILGDYTFCGCTSLKTVRLPKSMTEIAYNAFYGCTSLTALVVPNPDCTVRQDVPRNYHEIGDTAEDFDEYYVFSSEKCLGEPSGTVIYGTHDPEREDAAPFEEVYTYVLHEYSGSLEPFIGTLSLLSRYVENYAKVCGYTFYETGIFSDVKSGAWYEIPVAWAYGKGITGGVGEGKFGPNKKCTREEVMVFLWAANGSPEPENTVNPFKDVKKKDYYYKAVLWAVENGITGGIDDTHFGVGRVCDRAQVVTFLWAAAGSPEPETTENPFTDVKKKDYYYKAVLWAVENGITAGTTPTTFSPAKECTRAQVVTFLYAAYG